MGICVGTLRWTSYDSSIWKGLDQIASAYGLEENKMYPVTLDRSYQNTYSVTIQGLSVVRHGGKDKCLDTIQKFLDEAKVYLMTFGITKTRATFKFEPM